MEQNQLNAYLLGKHCLETGRRIAHSSTSGSSTSSRSTESLEDLDEYLDKVFTVDSGYKCMPDVVEMTEMNCEIYLQLEEITIEGLIPSNKADRTRDTFCKVATVNQDNSKFTFAKSSKKDNSSKGNLSVFQTDVKPSTLEPKWKHLNVALSIPGNASAKGTSFLLVDVCDDQGKGKSLGKVSVPLKDMSVEGVSVASSHPLPPCKGQPGGVVHLRYSLKVEVKDIPMLKALKGYEKMLEVLATKQTLSYSSSMNSLKPSDSPQLSHGAFSLSSHGSTLSSSCPSIIDNVCKPIVQKYWHSQANAEFDASTSRILSIVSHFCGITKLHEAFMRFTHISKHHCTVDESLVECLSTIMSERQHWESLSHTTLHGATELEKWEREQVHELMDGCESLFLDIKNSLAMDPSILCCWSSDQVESFACELRILKLMYSSKLVCELLPEEERDMKSTVANILHRSFSEWCQRLFSSVQDGNVREWFMLLKNINETLMRLAELLRPSFEELGIKFFQVIYVATDEQIATLFTDNKLKLKKNPEEALNVFMSLKNFRDLPGVLQEHFGGVELFSTNFHTHFNDLCPKWIQTRADRLCSVIDKATRTLQDVAVTEDDLFSVNSRDTVDFILMTCRFLDSSLQWPDVEKCLEFLNLILSHVSSSVSLFTGNVERNLKASHFYTLSSAEDFAITPKVCIALSDIEHLRLSVELQEISSYFPWVVATFGDVFEKESVRKTVQEMNQRVVKVQNSLIEEIVTRMTRHMKDWLKSSLKSKDCSFTCTLMSYLQTNVKTCAQHLHQSLLLRLLNGLWHSILSVFSTCISKVSRETVSCNGGKKNVLETLHDFFWADGSGMSRAELETEEYWNIHNILKLHTLSDEELLLMYMLDLVDRQTTTPVEAAHPSLSLMAEYNRPKGTVDVNLIRANNLPSLSHGHKQPCAYFKVSALPETRFPVSTRTKSEVYQPSANPLFNLDISFPTDVHTLADEGNIILIEMYGHSATKAHRPIGVAVLHCRDLPISSNDASLVDCSKKLFELAITRPPNSAAFKELCERNTREKFVKHMRKLMQ